MTDDATVDLIGSLVEAADLPGSVDGWESLAPGDVITPVSCQWPGIEAAVNAYLGERLPVKILVLGCEAEELPADA
ncbi:hypothetical protein DMH01_05610 [Amycolatopsis sp. WAC 04182]|uniref:hypothetical protein n=1 Tax=Amycolatopsis sp. WAC 04182 TaxID=2203198 RepID=UPI000F7B8A23|nr:hypothetical protein [Amycolatopsis sp. WAC 04182]RSN65829.1 hypothetical protein DMH01_05610 [Amycolatopsis sp. WAC 04182]